MESCPCKCRRECAFAPYNFRGNKPEELYALLSGFDLPAVARVLVCAGSHRQGQDYVDWLCNMAISPSYSSPDEPEIPPDELDELHMEIIKREHVELMKKIDLIYAARTRELDLKYAARTPDHASNISTLKITSLKSI